MVEPFRNPAHGPAPGPAPVSGGVGDEAEPPEPPMVRRLRRLVTTLTVVLILGVVAVAATLVIRLSALTAGPVRAGPDLAPVAAETLVLPAGERILALGRADGEVLVATEDAEGGAWLRIFDAASGESRSVTRIERR